jgi:hypothetical protein
VWEGKYLNPRRSTARSGIGKRERGRAQTLTASELAETGEKEKEICAVQKEMDISTPCVPFSKSCCNIIWNQITINILWLIFLQFCPPPRLAVNRLKELKFHSRSCWFLVCQCINAICDEQLPSTVPVPATPAAELPVLWSSVGATHRHDQSMHGVHLPDSWGWPLSEA